MRITLAIVAALLFSANHAWAQAPTLKLVNAVDKVKGVILFRETVYRTVQVEKEVREIVNGQAITKKVVENVYVPEERLATLELANARVITPDGKQLPIEDVWKRVKANTVVAVAGATGTPAEAYLRALNAETLIIIPPMAAPLPPLPPLPPPKKT